MVINSIQADTWLSTRNNHTKESEALSEALFSVRLYFIKKYKSKPEDSKYKDMVSSHIMTCRNFQRKVLR